MGRRNRRDDFSNAGIFLPDPLFPGDLNDSVSPKVVSHNRFAVLDNPSCRKRPRSRGVRKPARVHRTSKAKKSSLRLDIFDDLFSNKRDLNTACDGWMSSPTTSESSKHRTSPSTTSAQGVPLTLRDSAAPEFPEPCLLLADTFYHEMNQNKKEASHNSSPDLPKDWKQPSASTQPPTSFTTNAEKMRQSPKSKQFVQGPSYRGNTDGIWSYRLYPELADAYSPYDSNTRAGAGNILPQLRDDDFDLETFLGMNDSRRCECGKPSCNKRGHGHLTVSSWCPTCPNMHPWVPLAQGPPAEEKPAQDKPAQEKTAQESPTHEPLTQEPPTQKQPAQEQPASPLSETTSFEEVGSESTSFEEVESEKSDDGWTVLMP